MLSSALQAQVCAKSRKLPPDVSPVFFLHQAPSQDTNLELVRMADTSGSRSSARDSLK